MDVDADYARAEPHQSSDHNNAERYDDQEALDPMDMAQQLEDGPLRRDLNQMLRHGSVIVLSSPVTHPGQSDLALGLTALAGQRSVPILLLTANNALSDMNRSDLDALGFPKSQQISIVNPTEITAKHFGNRRSIWEIVEGFSVSNSGRESCMIVDAPPVKNQGQMQKLVEFADYFVLLESAQEPESPQTKALLGELSSKAHNKIHRMLL